MQRPIEHPVACVVEREEGQLHVELVEQSLADQALVKRFTGRTQGVFEQNRWLTRRGGAHSYQGVVFFVRLFQYAALRQVFGVIGHSRRVDHGWHDSQAKGKSGLLSSVTTRRLAMNTQIPPTASKNEAA